MDTYYFNTLKTRAAPSASVVLLPGKLLQTVWQFWQYVVEQDPDWPVYLEAVTNSTSVERIVYTLMLSVFLRLVPYTAGGINLYRRQREGSRTWQAQ